MNTTLERLICNPWVRIIVIFGFLLISRLLYLGTQPYPIGDAEMTQVSRWLAATGDLANPFPTPTGFTAHLAPGYPFVLSRVFLVFGPDRGLVAAGVIAILVSATTLALLPTIAESLGLPWMVGLLAAFIGLLPANIWEETSGYWEQNWTALLLMAGVSVAVYCIRKQHLGARFALGTAAVWALGIHFSPAIAPVFGCLAVVSVLAVWKTPARHMLVRFWGASGLALTLLLTPYTLRNYARFGALFFIRDNLGLELSVSNNPLARPTFDENYRLGGYTKLHPNANPEEAERLRSMGEIAYNADKMHQAVTWIRERPSAFAALTLRRLGRFWFPAVHPTRHLVVTWSIAVLGFVGLVLLMRDHPASGWPLAIVLISYPLMYYLVQTFERYSYPIRWAQLLLAGYLIYRVGPAVLRRVGRSGTNAAAAPAAEEIA